ncbi:MAG: hypothetical protein RLZZ297_2018 [Chloroflexota bacterium]|jgi:glycosyltransferase involved in cell wall biosynthesis
MNQYRSTVMYLIGRESNDDTLHYLTNLIQHVATLPFRIVIVEQSSRVHPAIQALAAAVPTIDVVTLDIPASAGLLLRLRILTAFFLQNTPAVVHVLSASSDTDIEAYAALWIAHVPTRIATIAEVTPTLRTDGIRLLANLVGQRVMHTLSDIVVYSASAKQTLQQEYRLKRTPIAVIPIGIDSAHYALHMTADVDRAVFQLPNDGPLVAAIGQLALPKGHSVLIHAMEHVWQQRPDARLVIVGRGDQSTALRALARQASQPDRIHFLPDVSDQRGFLRGVDVYVQPSFSEPMSFDLLVAMAMERPVVASSITNIYEIIESNASGLLVRAGSADALGTAISRVFNDAALRITISLNARTRVAQRFTTEQWHHATAALYKLV